MLRRKFIAGVGLAAVSAQAAVVKRDLPKVDLSFISKKMTLFRRDEWNGGNGKAWRMRGIGTIDRLTIHHAGGSENTYAEKQDVIVSLRNILEAHRSRGYGDVGYHLIIDYAGSVWEGRSLAYEGAHVNEQNERNIGVMLLGNFEIQEPSSAQISSMKRLVAILRKKYRIKQHRLYGHRDLGPSVCPGKNLYVYVQKLKKGQL